MRCFRLHLKLMCYIEDFCPLGEGNILMANRPYIGRLVLQ